VFHHQKKLKGTNKSPESRDLEKKLLVVEDDPDLGDVLCRVLSLSGYRASRATDGLVALEMLRSEDLPDVILLDMMLPRMNGWEFRRAQLEDERLKDIPVIVLSAVAESIEPIAAARRLRKPIDLYTLFSTIEEVSSA
jgi:two-component system, chemotaxis family, chemotaxis protein CheY